MKFIFYAKEEIITRLCIFTMVWHKYTSISTEWPKRTLKLSLFDFDTTGTILSQIRRRNEALTLKTDLSCCFIMLFKSSNIPPFCQNSLVWFEAKKHKSTILLNVAHPYVNNIARDCISYGLSIIGRLQNISYILHIGLQSGKMGRTLS